MARRSVLLIVALLIALVGTALIVVYVQGIDKRATEGQELVEVLTATSKIEVGESVADAQEAGKIDKKEVRRVDLVDGAVSSTGTISDLVALGTIYPGEQLIGSKFGTLGAAEAGLVIQDKRMAVAVELTDFERVAGFVNPGHEVAVFSTTLDTEGARPLPGNPAAHGTTRIILTRVPVLGVGTTSLTSKTTTNEDGEQVVEEVPRTILTLGLKQREAERLILADRTTDLTFALLTDDTEVKDQDGAYKRDLFPELFGTAQ
jgi:pilus assembly protein CpaB